MCKIWAKCIIYLSIRLFNHSLLLWGYTTPNTSEINIKCNTIETQKVLCKYHCKISYIWTVLRKYLTIMKIDYMCLLFKKFYLHHFHIKLLPFMPLFQLFVKLVVICFPYRLSICAKNNILTKYRNWNN